MGTIATPNTFSPNTTISSSQVNANFSTIVNEFNGSISAANLATDAVTTAKIANSNVTTAKINDDAVTAAKIDWAATGAGAGIWWEELGRTTLSGAADAISVSSFGARKYLKIIIETRATGGTNDLLVTFNGDTGNNYAIRIATNGAADSTSTSRANLSLAPSTAAVPNFVVMDVLNVSAVEKAIYALVVGTNTAGAGTAPERRELSGKWANTSAQITTVTATNSTGTGDFAIGSELIVLGHN